MSLFRKYQPSLASVLLMCVILYLIYPHYQYYVDPDGTAYLTIAKRYASGDIARAINGYWSPWACWLTAGFIRLGYEAILSGVIVNSIGAVGFLFASQSLFLRFSLQRGVQWLFSITLALFLCYAVFWQSFDDLWECFFLLAVLRLMLADDFVKRPALWVLGGVLGTLAYFAKAYSFPFFILNTVFCVYLLSRDSKAKWLPVCTVMIGVMVLCSMPWIYALHTKYGIWTISTSGPLNMSWYLVGHPYWKDGIRILLPPPYPDSPYYWEDPWYVNGATPHFWDSWHLAGLQVLRIGLNVWKFIVASFQLSVFFIVVTGVVKWRLIWKRAAGMANDVRVLMWSFLLFTVGYLLVNYEARYLWYMVPLSMILGIWLTKGLFKKGWGMAFYGLFAISFLVYPLVGMVRMYDEGKAEYNIAIRMKSNNLNEKFAGEANSKNVQKIARIAFFSGNSYYQLPRHYVNSDSMVDEMKRYNIKYCLYYTDPHNGSEGSYIMDDSHLSEMHVHTYPEINIDSVEGLKIFHIDY